MEAVIAPSVLSADFARLGEEVKTVVAAGADWIHLDVMDNHYVPNLTFGPVVCKSLRDFGIDAPFDAHLMVKPVDRMIEEMAEAGVDTITFHPEASDHVDRTINLIRDNGCSPGLALNPSTPLSVLEYVLDEIDMVLLMSVNPGFGGQKFIPYVLDKIQAVSSLIESLSRPVRLEVDGGVTVDNIAQIAAAGADTFVAGSAIFESADYGTTISKMRSAINSST